MASPYSISSNGGNSEHLQPDGWDSFPRLGATTIIQPNSHIDDGVTVASTVTVTEPFHVAVAGGQGGTVDLS